LMTYSAIACRIIDERIWYPHPPVPRPIIRQVVKPLQYKSHNVVIDINNQVAVVKLEAEFYNPNNQDLEGTYFFPLPADTAIKDFAMYMNGKKVKGELLDATRACKIYEDIVRRKKDPALLEFVGMNMIKLRVYPIIKHSSVISSEYIQLLNTALLK
ncbi:MAG: VIT domain-containing protein, partial [Planctomycetota bacterium]